MPSTVVDLPKKLTVEEVLGLLADLGDPLPKHRRDKVRTFYNLASRIGNNVVELGTYHGTGAIALGYGVVMYGRGHVWTVDDYREKVGWAGDQYGPHDRLTFTRRLLAANLKKAVTLVQQPCRQAASTWSPDRRINLLVWDLGVGGRLDGDVAAWSPLLVVGGTLAIHDTHNGTLGANGVVQHLKGQGWIDGGTFAGDVRVVIKNRCEP